MTPIQQVLATLAGIVITAGGSFLAVWYANRSAAKAKEVDVKAAAYTAAQAISTEAMAWLRGQIAEMKTAHSELKTEHDDLKEELRTLRTKTEVVEEDLEIAVNWMQQFLAWEQDGSRPPRPHIPNRLRKRIKQTLLVEQRIEQLQHNREDG